MQQSLERKLDKIQEARKAIKEMQGFEILIQKSIEELKSQKDFLETELEERQLMAKEI